MKPRVLVLICLLGFWTISLRHLTTTPPVYEDEPWQASTGWKLAAEGTFGSDLFAGLNGMEERYYGYMPVHPLLLALIFNGAGVGLFQARFEAVTLGLLAVALTYSLAVRLSGRREVGLLALLLLLFTRLTGRTPSQISGIVLLDVARIARYDVAVPVFGLAALHAYLWARDRDSGWWYFVAGLLVGLAGLSHLYGLFWLPVLLGLTLWDRRGRGGLLGSTLRFRLGPLLFGALLPWLPYGLYVLGDLPGWRAQTGGYAERFQLLNPGWYWRNLLRENLRYRPGVGPTEPPLFFRAGFWATWLIMPPSLLMLWRRAMAGARNARALFFPAVALPLLFALLIYLKLSNYLVAIVPLWAIVIAWGGIQGWRWFQSRPYRLWARLVLAVLLLALVVEGATRWVVLDRAATTLTPYANYIGRVRAQLPTTGARVLGLHNYWFGLEEYDYRSFAVPIIRSQQEADISFSQALEQISPDAVLVDHRMRAFLEDHPDAAAQFESWLSAHGARLSARVTDRTYGTMEIYRFGSSSSSSSFALTFCCGPQIQHELEIAETDLVHGKPGRAKAPSQ